MVPICLTTIFPFYLGMCDFEQNAKLPLLSLTFLFGFQRYNKESNKSYCLHNPFFLLLLLLQTIPKTNSQNLAVLHTNKTTKRKLIQITLGNLYSCAHYGYIHTTNGIIRSSKKKAERTTGKKDKTFSLLHQVIYQCRHQCKKQ